jgi:hypothetical protein
MIRYSIKLALGIPQMCSVRILMHQKLLTISILSIVVAIFADKAYAQRFISDAWFSVQFPGQHSETATSAATTEVNTGVAIGGDIGIAVAPWVEFGFGIQGQLGRAQNPYQGDFSFVDFFYTFRFPIRLGPVTLYPVGRIGLGSFNGNEDYLGSYGNMAGGPYYSVGLGFRSPKLFEHQLFGRNYRYFLFVEGTYDSNFGSLYNSSSGSTAYVLYSSFNLFMGLGNKF